MGARAARRWRLPRALPPLSGAAWWLFLTVWTVAVGFTLYSAASFATREGASAPVQGLYGIRMGVVAVTGVSGDAAVVQFVLSREARAAGVRPGDRILSIDGRRIEGSFTKVVEALGRPAVIHVAILSMDGRTAVRRLTFSQSHLEGYAASGMSYRTYQRLIDTASLLSDIVIPVVLAILLLARRARDPLAPWVSLTMIVWALSDGPAAAFAVDHGSPALATAVRVASPVGGSAIMAVLALFPTGRFSPRQTWLVVLGAVPLAYWFRSDASSFETDIALLIGFSAAVAVVGARYRAMPPGVQRQQIRWALFGFCASLLGLALLTVDEQVIAVVPDAAAYVWLGLLDTVFDLLFNVSLLAGMTLGLMRYRLYDADATISRSVAYGAITLSLLAVFAGSEKVIEILGEEYFGSSLGALAGGLGAAIAAVMVVPFHHRVTHWAERRFRTGLVTLRHGLPLLVADLRETATPAALADEVLLRVEKGVRARHSALVAGGAVLDARDIEAEAVERWLAANPLALSGTADLVCRRGDDLFPVRVPLRADGVSSVGWLLLGPRPDGTFYGREERAALREIADPVARALAVAFDREQREAARRAREEARELRLGALGRQVDALRRFVEARYGVEISR